MEAPKYALAILAMMLLLAGWLVHVAPQVWPFCRNIHGRQVFQNYRPHKLILPRRLTWLWKYTWDPAQEGEVRIDVMRLKVSINEVIHVRDNGGGEGMWQVLNERCYNFPFFSLPYYTIFYSDHIPFMRLSSLSLSFFLFLDMTH